MLFVLQSAHSCYKLKLNSISSSFAWKVPEIGCAEWSKINLDPSFPFFIDCSLSLLPFTLDLISPIYSKGSEGFFCVWAWTRTLLRIVYFTHFRNSNQNIFRLALDNLLGIKTDQTQKLLPTCWLNLEKISNNLVEGPFNEICYSPPPISLRYSNSFAQYRK